MAIYLDSIASVIGQQNLNGVLPLPQVYKNPLQVFLSFPHPYSPQLTVPLLFLPRDQVLATRNQEDTRHHQDHSPHFHIQYPKHQKILPNELLN